MSFNFQNSENMEHFGSIRKKARQRRSLDLPQPQCKTPKKISSQDDLGGVYMQINMEDLGLFGPVEGLQENFNVKPTHTEHRHYEKHMDSSGERKSSDDHKPSSHSRPPKARRTRDGHRKPKSGRRSEMIADLRAFQGQGHGQDIKQLADLFYDSKTNMVCYFFSFFFLIAVLSCNLILPSEIYQCHLIVLM